MSILDDEVQAFVDHTLDFYPADAVDFSVEEQRKWYNALCADLAVPLPDGLIISDDFITGKDNHQIPIRKYQISDEATEIQVIYAHGGGFVVGDLESHNDVCAELAKACQLDVIAVDYRLAPENHYPDDLNDCLAVVDDVFARGHRLILVGDSAGGTLQACVSNLRSIEFKNRLLGQVLIYPALSLDMDTPSMHTHADAPMLTKADIEYYIPIRSGEEEPSPDDPGYSPMANKDFSPLPPTHLFPAEVDPLCDDCAIYAETLMIAGVPASNHLEVGQGLVHGCLRARHTSSKAKKWFDQICDSISQLASQ